MTLPTALHCLVNRQLKEVQSPAPGGQVLLLEVLGVPPQAGVQLLPQVDVVALVPAEGVGEFVRGLEPGQDEDHQEEL